MSRLSVRTALVALGLLVGACSGKTTPTSSPSETATAAAPDNPAQVSRIEGRVVGHDGQPLSMAHVRVLGGDDPPQARTDDEGRFVLEVPRTGLFRVEVTGIDHAQTRFIAVVDDVPLTLDVQLGTYERAEPLGELVAAIWTDDPEKNPPRSRPLSKADDGTYQTVVQTDAERVWYQINGTAGPSRIVNGPVAHAYEYDGGGDYRSIVLPTDGKVTIVVDPSQLPPAGRTRAIELADPKSPTGRLLPIIALADAEREKMDAMMMEAAPVSPQESRAVAERYDWGPARTAVVDALDAESHPQVRRALLSTYFSLGSYSPTDATTADRERAKELIGDLAADDPAWGMFASSMVRAAELSDDPRHQVRLDTLLDQELPIGLAGELLFMRLVGASLDGNEAGVRKAYDQLQAERFAGTVFAAVSRQYDPDRAMQTGQKFPDFEFATIGKDGRQKTITNEDMSGKVFLVDVWATWCKPCVAEMDSLHAAYDKYKTQRKVSKDGREFEILSVSVDKTTDEVTAFRKERYPMPWRHAHLGFAQAGELFGIAGIPYAVLVDETGTIIATSPVVRGASLDELLERVLAKPRPEPKGAARR